MERLYSINCIQNLILFTAALSISQKQDQKYVFGVTISPYSGTSKCGCFVFEKQKH